MAPIGPSLPPSLPKRKRTQDDDARAESPPSKILASETSPKNGDEIALDDDSSDDDYGPSAARSGTSIGPTLPSSLGASRQSRGHTASSTNKDEIPLEDGEDDESDSYGPSVPQNNGPTKAAPTRPSRPSPPPVGPTVPPLDTQPSRPRHVYGPTAPPASLSERPPASASDSDSDSDYGPALPTSSTQQARHTAALAAQAQPSGNSKAPQRDDWMLAPPTAHGYRAPDPTKLKNRKFNSGPRSGANGGTGGAAGEISSIWTETPEQKRRRLENAVLGRDEGSSGPQATVSGEGSKRAKDEEERTERIRSNLEVARGLSLYDEHQRREGGKGGRIEQEEDDPSKRAFDREKDMKLGGQIGTKQRRELMHKAADFGGRFTKGKYL